MTTVRDERKMTNRPLLVHVATIPQSLYYFLAGQCNYMKTHGFEVYGVSSPGILLKEFAEREGIEVKAVEIPRSITPIRDLAAVWHLWRLLRKLQPQIVHAHTPKGGLLGMVAAWLTRVPIRIYHIHGSPYVTAHGWKRFLFKFTERLSCILANRVLVVSRSVWEKFVADGIFDTRKAKILHKGSINGIDAEKTFNPAFYSRNQIRFSLGISPADLVVGFIGRLVRDKGIGDLLEAWEGLKKEFTNLYLLIAGEFEARDSLPLKAIQAIRSDERIIYLGAVKETAKLYAAIDVLALPTYREGLPLVPLEAQAMGIPVVATKVMGCVDAVEDAVSGILVPAGASSELAEALKTYLKDKNLRRTHGNNGRAKMLIDFRPKDLWQAQCNEYLDLLKAKRLT